eukprot:623067-Amorphochlora_amoeboformis.AAC.1
MRLWKNSNTATWYINIPQLALGNIARLQSFLSQSAPVLHLPDQEQEMKQLDWNGYLLAGQSLVGLRSRARQASQDCSFASKENFHHETVLGASLAPRIHCEVPSYNPKRYRKNPRTRGFGCARVGYRKIHLRLCEGGSPTPTASEITKG